MKTQQRGSRKVVRQALRTGLCIGGWTEDRGSLAFHVRPIGHHQYEIDNDHENDEVNDRRNEVTEKDSLSVDCPTQPRRSPLPPSAALTKGVMIESVKDLISVLNASAITSPTAMTIKSPCIRKFLKPFTECLLRKSLFPRRTLPEDRPAMRSRRRNDGRVRACRRQACTFFGSTDGACIAACNRRDSKRT